MLAFASLFTLIAPSMAETPGVCMDLEIQFQELSRLASEADHSVRQAQDDVRAHEWMYDSRTDMQRNLESLTDERNALQRLLAVKGMTPDIEASLMAIAQSEAETLWNLSHVEHQIAGLEHELIVATQHADIAFGAASRAEDRLDRCLGSIVERDRPFISR